MNSKQGRRPMPERDPRKRIADFGEVALGYSPEDAQTEASRCLNCRNPRCVEGCPVGVDIPGFISLIAAGDYAAAAEKIKERNNLPAICGRVCPQETQCEKQCILGKKGEAVAIGRLERFAADWQLTHAAPAAAEATSQHKSQKVAVVGSGPAGLTCAADLARLGYQVTIFEAFHKAGGVLTYGIPEFRLPKQIVESEVEYIRSLGVEFQFNMVVGRTITVDELLGTLGYDAIFIATGAGLPYFLNIPGENLKGVYSANEFLTRVNLMKAYLFPQYATPVFCGEKVAVIGGGNVAMDAARTAVRLGAKECTVVYRRSRQELPAREEEVGHAEEEGITFQFLASPTRIVGTEDGWVKELECIHMKLGEPDASGRRRPLPIEGSNFSFAVDTVIVAVGQGPNPLISRTTGDLATNRKGNILAKPDTGQTSKPGVFAGGDIVTGAATVIQAMGAGKAAARAIDRYLQKKD